MTGATSPTEGETMTTFAIDLRRRGSAAESSCDSRTTPARAHRAARTHTGQHTQTASAVAQVRSTWATACAYIIVYGVAFVFALGPAGNLLASAGSATQAQSARFTMILATALVLGVGSLSLSFGLGRMIDDSASRRGLRPSRADASFAAWGVVFAAIVAGFYTASASMVFGGFVPAIGWAAAVGILAPGALAAITARMTGPQMARRSRDLAASSLAAVAVVGVAVYLALGVASGTADIATIAGASVLP